MRRLMGVGGSKVSSMTWSSVKQPVVGVVCVGKECVNKCAKVSEHVYAGGLVYACRWPCLLSPVLND